MAAASFRRAASASRRKAPGRSADVGGADSAVEPVSAATASGSSERRARYRSHSAASSRRARSCWSRSGLRNRCAAGRTVAFSYRAVIRGIAWASPPPTGGAVPPVEAHPASHSGTTQSMNASRVLGYFMIAPLRSCTPTSVGHIPSWSIDHNARAARPPPRQVHQCYHHRAFRRARQGRDSSSGHARRGLTGLPGLCGSACDRLSSRSDRLERWSHAGCRPFSTAC